MADHQQYYPTPPSTTSPENYHSEFQKHDHNYPGNSRYTSSYLPQSQSSIPQKISAQESYFHSYSAPSSPKHDATFSRPQKPVRRRSSPLSGPDRIQHPAARSWTPPASYRPPRPYSPSLNRLSPRPLHFSPSNPVPSPYSAARPKPRPGLLRRIAVKIEEWIKRLMSWSRKNPLLAGALTFVPVLAVAGIVRVAKAVGKRLSSGGKQRGQSEGENKGDVWEWGLNEFKGFGGSKAGPLDGILKTLQMALNHWCKLTPSVYPRAASILMELYFLDVKK